MQKLEAKLQKLLNPYGTKEAISKVEKSDVPIVDKQWIQSRYLVSDSDIPEAYVKHRYESSASYKFTDTRMGGNITINPRPQFTRYCDIRNPGRYQKRNRVTKAKSTDIGMGRYYSESLDDNQQTVFFEFGLPKFNSLSDFFLRAIDYQDSVIANTGSPSVGYTIGKAAGNIAMLAAFPLVTLAVWTTQIGVKLLFGSGLYSYYRLEPKMHMYWTTVNQIVTQLATEMGLLVPELMEEKNPEPGEVKVGAKIKMSQTDIDELKKYMPDGVIGKSNYIDVFAIATRAQKLANAQKEKMYTAMSDNNNLSIDGALKSEVSITESINRHASFELFLETVSKSLGSLLPGDAEPEKNEETLSEEQKAELAKKGQDFQKNKVEGAYKEQLAVKENTRLENLAKTIDSTVRQGGSYAVFAVDYTGSVSESFSNEIGNINTGDKIKQMSRASRDLKFSVAGGNIIGTTMEDVMGAVKGIVAGALDSATFGLGSVAQTIFGGGYIDIPKKWEDSNVSMPSVTYNMQLVSPYGNIISQLQDIYIPLAMILAGTLPLATGKSSYTSPYICSLYSKGIQNIKLGMITSLTLTRGTSNLGFDKNRRPLAIDVSFQVTDFSSSVAAPVNSSVFKGMFNFSLEDDTPLGNYIGVLGSRDIITNKYATHRAKLRFSRSIMSAEQMISPNSWGMRIGETVGSVLGPLVAPMTLTGNYRNDTR